MKLYHGTKIENKDSILENGLEPKANWDSGDELVVSLSESPDQALLEAYVVDLTKNEFSDNSELSPHYVVFEVDVGGYQVTRHQVDELWVKDTIRPEHLRQIKKASLAYCKEEYENKTGSQGKS